MVETLQTTDLIVYVTMMPLSDRRLDAGLQCARRGGCPIRRVQWRAAPSQLMPATGQNDNVSPRIRITPTCVMLHLCGASRGEPDRSRLVAQCLLITIRETLANLAKRGRFTQLLG
jgi:hypothetical protein